MSVSGAEHDDNLGTIPDACLRRSDTCHLFHRQSEIIEEIQEIPGCRHFRCVVVRHCCGHHVVDVEEVQEEHNQRRDDRGIYFPDQRCTSRENICRSASDRFCIEQEIFEEQEIYLDDRLFGVCARRKHDGRSGRCTGSETGLNECSCCQHCTRTLDWLLDGRSGQEIAACADQQCF